MGWWKADPVPAKPSVTPDPSAITQSAPPPEPVTECPVDPKTRAIWLQQHTKSQTQPQATSLPETHPPISTPPAATFASTPTAQCSSDTISQKPSLPSTTTSTSQYGTRSLSHDRVVSSIPRASPLSPTTADSSPSNPQTLPSNSESETGHDASSGNWIYPSEHQFFTAVMRKNSLPTTSPDPSSLATTVPSIIPIHNAVNERAWSLIKAWEGNTSARCGGPKLLSFSGLGAGPDDEPGLWGGIVGYARLLDPRTSLSPRARMKALGGYQAPFDRHDWVVERCGGEKVEYVIDFYQGKSNNSAAPGGLNFYLDVRPKLNSAEGWKMRGSRFLGFEEGRR